MSGLPATALTAVLLAPLYLWLSVRVVSRRRAGRVSLGDGGDAVLLARIRAHGNFAEYAPFALILLALAEAQGTPFWIVAFLGLALVAGRVLHALALGLPGLTFRVAGMVLTLGAIGLSAAAILVSTVAPLVL